MAADIMGSKRILIIRYRFIGDTILTAPFIRNVHYAFPEAKIDVLVGPQSGEVLEGCPYVNEFITFDTTRFHKYDQGKGKKKNFWFYVGLLAPKKYDLVFVLKRSWSSALLALLTGAKYRVGYATEGRQILLTQSVKFDPNMHEVDSTLSVLECAGIKIRDRQLEAWVSDAERAMIKGKCEFPADRDRILIHAAAAHPDKVYPLDHWAEVMKEISSQRQVQFYFSGAEQDCALYEELQSKAGLTGINLAGKLSLRESMALYEKMDLAIGVDSGPAHLAASVGTPTIALFGPTDPVRWRPYGEKNLALYDTSLSCRPCHYKKTCVNRECLTEFSPSIVAQAALMRLGTKLEPSKS